MFWVSLPPQSLLQAVSILLLDPGGWPRKVATMSSSPCSSLSCLADGRDSQESSRQGDFPGGPVVKSLSFQCKGVRIRSRLRELRSHMQCSVAKKIKILKKKWWERAGGRRKSEGRMFILLVPLWQVATVVCNPLFLGTYNYSLSSPLQAGQGEVKAPYCCQPQGCAIFYCIFLNPTHTFVNILFILFTSIYPIWVCHLFTASILTNRMSSAL